MAQLDKAVDSALTFLKLRVGQDAFTLEDLCTEIKAVSGLELEEKERKQLLELLSQRHEVLPAGAGVQAWEFTPRQQAAA